MERVFKFFCAKCNGLCLLWNVYSNTGGAVGRKSEMIGKVDVNKLILRVNRAILDDEAYIKGQ